MVFTGVHNKRTDTIKSLTAGKNDAGQRLDRFLSKALPLLPPPLLYKYIRLKRIKVNGKRAGISTRLEPGDVIDLYINDEFFGKEQNESEKYDFLRASKELSIAYEDENILLLDKKAGLLCHPDGDEYTDTLISRVKRYLYEKGEYGPENEHSFSPALANRIDRNTGGIVIAAKNAEALRVLNEKIKKREIAKLYLAVCHGKLEKERGVLRGYLVKDEEKNRVFIDSRRKEGYKEIQTEYRVLDYKNGLSLVEVSLLTGRTHQIRAHMASAGHPLLGDGKYGTNAQNKRFGAYKKQFLYSYKLIFDFNSPAGLLDYLKGRAFEIENVWFRDEFERI